MKKLLSVLLVMVMIFTASVEAGSHGGSCSKKGGCKGKADWSAKLMKKAHCLVSHQEELGLSDEQVTKIKDLKYNTKKALIKKKADIELAKIDVKKAMWNDPIDVKAVNGLVDKKYALKSEKAKLLVAACAELQSVLTADQKKELKSLKKKIKCKA